MLRFLTQPLNWKQTRVKRKSEQKKLDHKNKIEKENKNNKSDSHIEMRILNQKNRTEEIRLKIVGVSIS